MKNSIEPVCWKWWSFDRGETFYTVDDSEHIHSLLRLNYVLSSSVSVELPWELEDVGNSEDESLVDSSLTLKHLLRIDKLFGSTFATKHKDYIDPQNRQKAFYKGAKAFYDSLHGAVGAECIELDLGAVDAAYEVFLDS